MRRASSLQSGSGPRRGSIAPVTIDNADYIFSRAYDIAFDKGDFALGFKARVFGGHTNFNRLAAGGAPALAVHPGES